MQDTVLTPSDFAALINQTLEFAYTIIIIEGELSDFRVSKNRWLYFDLKDEGAAIKFFGTVYMLPGPLQDGMKVRVVGSPRLHPRFGFSVNVQSIQPVGEGSIKKAADLLEAKLKAEGLFAPERKRPLPETPQRIGLITAEKSAAAADFIKILNERWGGVEVLLVDCLVQGNGAPKQIINALELLNRSSSLPEVIVITRGGGSLDDLAAFNDERVVRAVAASRVPTLVAIGHEVDISLAELAADVRASTPTNAAGLVVPSRTETIAALQAVRASLGDKLRQELLVAVRDMQEAKKYLTSQVFLLLNNAQNQLISNRKLMAVFDPQTALKRGYAIIRQSGRLVTSVKQVAAGGDLKLQVSDGTITARVEGIGNRG